MNKLKSPESIFAVLATIFGLAFIFITPPFQVPDEQSHFYRAFQLAEFNLVADIVQTPEGSQAGGTMPVTVVRFVDDMLGNVRFHPDVKFDTRKIGEHMNDRVTSERQPLQFAGSAIYSPVPYVPQSVAVFIAKTANLPLPLYVYLGRLFNLATFVVLVFAAIKLTPMAKWLLGVLALLPMTLYTAASLSADAVTNALAFLCVALFIRAYRRTQLVNWQEALTILAASLALSLSKPGYLPLVFLFALLPAQRFGRKKNQYAFGAILAGANIAVAAAWAAPVSRLAPYVTSVANPGQNINYHEQMNLVLHQPLVFAGALSNTYLLNAHGSADDVARGFIGVLGWLDTPLPLWAVLGGYALIAFAVFITMTERPGLRLGRVRSGVVVGIGVLILLFISASLYLAFTEVGRPFITGLQGRYFIAAAIGMTPLLLTAKKWPTPRRYAAIMPVGSAVLLSISIVFLLLRYYITLTP